MVVPRVRLVQAIPDCQAVSAVSGPGYTRLCGPVLLVSGPVSLLLVILTTLCSGINMLATGSETKQFYGSYSTATFVCSGDQLYKNIRLTTLDFYRLLVTLNI